jgi:hypothetical protein
MHTTHVGGGERGSEEEQRAKDNYKVREKTPILGIDREQSRSRVSRRAKNKGKLCINSNPSSSQVVSPSHQVHSFTECVSCPDDRKNPEKGFQTRLVQTQ